MARQVPKTKAGKAAKREKVFGEFKRGTLRSGSGQTVTSRDQAIAIALSESGEARKDKKRATRSRETARGAARKRGRRVRSAKA